MKISKIAKKDSLSLIFHLKWFREFIRPLMKFSRHIKITYTYNQTITLVIVLSRIFTYFQAQKKPGIFLPSSIISVPSLNWNTILPS